MLHSSYVPRAAARRAALLGLLSAGASLLSAGCGDDAAPADASAEAGPRPDGSTDAGETRDSSTSGCEPGKNSCACAAGDRCERGLRCTAKLCEPCPAGTRNCPCDAANSCQAPLACISGTCAAASCSAGSVDCPCSDGRCDPGLGCAADNVCRTCNADQPGCACRDGKCSAGLLCEPAENQCRAPKRCADASKDCAEHQACVERSGSDAVCIAEACQDGYRWDPGSSGCVACPACRTGSSCLASGAGIGDECASAFRSCIERDGLARCGGCIADAEEIDGACLPKLRCGDAVCTDEQYCDRLAEVCNPLPCPAGQAKRPGASAACAPCTNSCSGPGLTGRYWPFRTKTDKCVCETHSGYFLEAGAFMAEQCDADRDGWVRQEADDSAIRDDEALLQNARCEILRADRVVLNDEYGGKLTLRSCRDEGFVRDDGACSEPVPLRLLEGPRNDAPGPINSTKTPLYGRGSAGRRLTGPELNGISKACVSDLGDFDDDGIEDLNQVQPRTFDSGDDDRARLAGFAYFVELQRAYFTPPASGESYGALVIEERSRCDSSTFPLHYRDDDDYASVGGSEAADPGYWRSCTRFRDASYDASASLPGYDFAQYTCAATTPTGSCAGSLPGAAHASLDYAAVDPNTTLLRDTGLCALQDRPAFDRKFRGLNHASQFRCLRVIDSPSRTSEAAPSKFAGPRPEWIFNDCSARSCAGAAGACAESQSLGAAGAEQPLFDCKVATPLANQVGFAARNYVAYGSGALYDPPPGSPPGTYDPPATYASGCVNEDTEWGAKLCPEPEFVRGYETDSYGRYSCFGGKQRFIWLGNGAPPVRSTLYWSAGSAGPPNLSGWSFE